MNSGEQQGLTIKDVAEVIGLVNAARSQQPQSDPAAMANALAVAMKSGVEAAKSNSSTDPVAIMTMLNQNQQQGHQQQLQMYDTLGKIAGKETPEIQMKRLDLLAQREQREFERSIEAGKEKRQSDMIKGIGGAVSKALESPILREAGRKMAETVPGVSKVASTVTQVQSSAARSTLDHPLEEVYSFKCGTCGADYRFSRKALTMIESSPTKLWACPRCGAAYTLGEQAGTDAGQKKNDDGSTGVF